ncbi:MAG: tyrosine-type recombinase/integrase [Clostridia bacterium]|nr:tyrosine-type recombinase/integrase [Clostridia bacterium]
MLILTAELTDAFEKALREQERAVATIEKYMRDLRAFWEYVGDGDINKQAVLDYKAHLQRKYATASVNSVLSSLGAFFVFCERRDLCVKRIKQQKNVFVAKEKELSRAEYERLLQAAQDKGNRRLYLLMQTVCGCGIRVSELQFITVEAVACGYADIACKGKRRRVYLPGELCRQLKNYVKEKGIRSGAVFVTRSGKPLDRSNIWLDMKKLCQAARVAESKVFPHNLRHLFARTFYSIHKDIVRLADILGHSTVDTTRIYTMESGDVHCKQINRLNLVRC